MNKQVEQIKAEIEQLINQLQADEKKAKHPITTISIRERIATLEEVMDIPKSQAEAYNGGLIRYWFKEGKLYIDAGGNVLYIKADTDEGTQELFDLFFGEVKVC